jgi:drug/metabolite transporter (DMT)-like permease
MALAYAALACAVVLWGVAFPVMKFAVEHLGPLEVGFARMGFGALGGLGLFLAGGPPAAGGLRPALRRHAGTLLVLSGLVGYAQNFALTFGIARTPATTASLLPPLNPICTVLLAAWLLGERITARQWSGFAVALAGVVLLAFRNGRPTWADLAGPLILAVAPISWGVYTVLSKRVLADIRPLTLTAVTLLGGFGAMLPWASPPVATRLAGGTAAEWAAVLYLGLGSMAVAYALWYVGLSRIGAATTGATALGIPLVGVAASWLFLGEPLGPVVVAAGALILAGLHLVLGGAARG